MRWRFVACAALPLLVAAALPAQQREPQLAVTIVADEADAALEILRERAAGRAPGAAAWERLFTSEGYRRLKAREHSMQRAFEDSTFRAFLMSDTLLARFGALEQTLGAWTRVHAAAAARRAFSYLPADTRLRARIYPVIKPRTNSFVFETRTNPAIFLYLDPLVAPAKFENTLAHELHHVGVASACPEVTGDTSARRTALDWMSGFSEGRAMLAAAGSPEVHPHAVSDSAERAVWDRDVAKAAADMRRLEEFFTSILDGSLTGDALTRAGFGFVTSDGVPQGPFYTVGWLMASTIERVHGRPRLVASLCDPLAFLTDYNTAASALVARGGGSLPRWSASFLGRLSP